MSRRARAMSLTLLPQEIRDLSVITLESMPPQFVIRGVREMPTPGWKFTLDSVDVDPALGRILVKVTDIAPTGIVPQVITPTPIDLRLGSVPVGRYVVEVRTRRERRRRHALLQAFAVEATAKPTR